MYSLTNYVLTSALRFVLPKKAQSLEATLKWFAVIRLLPVVSSTASGTGSELDTVLRWKGLASLGEIRKPHIFLWKVRGFLTSFP